MENVELSLELAESWRESVNYVDRGSKRSRRSN